jgi:hypothetical protein
MDDQLTAATDRLIITVTDVDDGGGGDDSNNIE